MSDEREFLENLLNQRFNFFMAFAGLVAAGFVASSESAVRLAALVLGSAVGFLLLLTLERAQVKLTLVMEYVYNDLTHPAAIVNRAASQTANPLARHSRARLVGSTIPRVITGFFVLATAVYSLQMVVA